METEFTQKKRLVLDATFLFDQYAFRGIGRYGKEMFGRIIQKIYRKQLGEWEVHLIGFNELEENLAQLHSGLEADSLMKVAPLVHFHSLGRPKLSSPASNLLIYKRRIKPLVQEIKPDAYWAVHFDRGVPSDLCPTIVTVHDAIPLVTGNFSSKGPVINYLKGLFYKAMWNKVRQASLILTSSEFSRHDLINYGDIDPHKVKVAYLGISDVFKRKEIPTHTKQHIELLNKYDIQTIIRAGQAEIAPYLFYDGGLEQNKNWLKLLQIFGKLASHIPELKLIVTGGDFRYDPQSKTSSAANERAQTMVDMAAELGVLEKIIPTGKLTDVEMSILLSQAAAYINLSSYEGFGFGPVQAMAAEVPAVVANLSCFPEIVGDAAVLVDPEDILGSTAKVLELITSQTLRQELIQKGQERVKLYEWDNCFQHSWELVTEIIHGK